MDDALTPPSDSRPRLVAQTPGGGQSAPSRPAAAGQHPPAPAGHVGAAYLPRRDCIMVMVDDGHFDLTRGEATALRDVLSVALAIADRSHPLLTDVESAP